MIGLKLLLSALLMGTSVAFAGVTVENADWREGSPLTGTPDQHPHVLVTGIITSGMAAEFENALAIIKEVTPFTSMGGIKRPTVILSSPGGDVKTAMIMGQLARDAAAFTVVMPENDCSSACVLILSGGVERFVTIGSRIGIHRPAFSDFQGFANTEQTQAIETYDSLLKLVEDYMLGMRIDPEFTKAMLAVNSSDMRYIGQEEAIRYGLMGADVAFQEYDMARYRATVSEKEYRLTRDYLNCLEACSTGECQALCVLE